VLFSRAVHLEREFTVARPREEVARALDSDEAIAALFPDTRVTNRGGGVRETLTRVSLAGSERELRFVFQTGADGSIRFSKVCDGRIWRSLEGEIRFEDEGGARTRVRLSMDGRTRALVPELAISGPMRGQLDEMVLALRKRIDAA
jgi:carbon monoxide dehydrogenase subunit G